MAIVSPEKALRSNTGQPRAERSPARSETDASSLRNLPTKVRDHDGEVVSLTLNRFSGLASVAWMVSRMQLAKRPLQRTGAIGLHKLMGTGGGAGFSTRPNLRVWSLLATWPNGTEAAAAIDASVFRERAARAEETATLFLAPLSSRGSWDGGGFRSGDDPDPNGPIAALTRASLRPSVLARFWRRVPSISRTIEGEAAVRFMIGMGEVPYLHQVTFSIWDDAEAMRRFSRESATHGEAVRRAAEEGWFSEQLFARFRPLGAVGTWNGEPATALIAPVPSS